jgi:WSC domain
LTDLCIGNFYRYAGLEEGGICYCGETVNGTPLPDSACNTPCSADATQNCGATGAISIYSDTTFPVVNLNTIADYKPLGCWSDALGTRTLYHQLDIPSMTTEKCLAGCKAAGFPLAGTEFGSE